MSLIKRYQEFSHLHNLTAGEPNNEIHLLSGLAEETGEVMGKFKRLQRGDYTVGRFTDEVKSELGDVLWHISELANHYGFTLEDLMRDNMQKLSDRVDADTIKGEGDRR